MDKSADFAHAERLLSRILAGEQDLQNEFASALLAPMAEWLKNVYHSIASDLCDTAVEDIIMRLIKRPDRFDSKIQGFELYVKKIVQRRLIDLIRTEKSKQSPAIRGKNKSWKRVELDLLETYYVWGDEEDPSIACEREEDLRLLNDMMGRFKSRIPNTESQILDLVLHKTRSIDPYSEVLGIHYVMEEARLLIVKRAKDRVLKKFRRFLESNHLYELWRLLLMRS